MRNINGAILELQNIIEYRKELANKTYRTTDDVLALYSLIGALDLEGILSQLEQENASINVNKAA